MSTEEERDIILDAMKLIGVIEPGELPSRVDYEFAAGILRKLADWPLTHALAIQLASTYKLPAPPPVEIKREAQA